MDLLHKMGKIHKVGTPTDIFRAEKWKYQKYTYRWKEDTKEGKLVSNMKRSGSESFPKKKKESLRCG